MYTTNSYIMELQTILFYFRILYFFSSAEVSDDNDFKIMF